MDMSDVRPESAVQTRSLQPPQRGDTEGRCYLLVLREESSAVFHLPETGVITIGRAPEADLLVQGTSISRRHARIVMRDGEASIMDLDSSNGTHVNGHRLHAAHTLASGDVVSVGEVTLVLHCAAPPRTGASRGLVSLEDLRRRIEEESERSLCYQRPLTLLAISFAESPPRRTSQAITPHLPMVHVAAWGGEAELLVLVPELSGDQALDLSTRLLGGLSPDGRAAKAGVATCPADGCDADTLLSAAHAAAKAARPGAVLPAAEAATRLVLGERSILIADPAVVRIFDLIRRLAAGDLPVLITGETGVGKENAAFAVHHLSPRSRMPFVAINCAALQDTLAESELFGHEKGAFSGAISAKPGLLEGASGGTIFLDEVGELSAVVQAKLLRVLEARRLTRVGSTREREVDVRIVAATNRHLEEQIQAGRFRQDLFFRLSGATVFLPPLRDRPREVPILARTFLQDACARMKRPAVVITEATMQQLLTYRWPGNVRELKNTMDYAAATVPGTVLEPFHLPERVRGPRLHPAPAAPSAPSAPESAPAFRPLSEEMRELERRRLAEALEAAGGVKARAAKLIQVPLRTFMDRLKVHGLAAK